MPFPTKERAFQLKAQNNKCQTMVYTEASGFQICGSTKDLELDHLFPESQLLYEGGLDPNHSPGILRCQMHHTGQGMTRDEDRPGYGRIALYGEPQWSRHPDVGAALVQYREGDKDAFKKVGAAHVQAAEHGVRITNDDSGVIYYEQQRVAEMNHRYVVATGETPPDSKNHKKYKRKHWTDIFFGGE